MEHKTFDAEPVPDQQDISDNRLWAAAGYIGILCLLPLLLRKDSPYAQHHGKQGFILFVAWIILSFINIIPLLGQIIWFFGTIVFFGVMIVGIIKALQGDLWEIPYIGHYAKSIKTQ